MVIPLNRVYCKHPIYHKTSYNESGMKASQNSIFIEGNTSMRL